MSNLLSSIENQKMIELVYIIRSLSLSPQQSRSQNIILQKLDAKRVREDSFNIAVKAQSDVLLLPTPDEGDACAAMQGTRFRTESRKETYFGELDVVVSPVECRN
jgi:hypothetical protein